LFTKPKSPSNSVIRFSESSVQLQFVYKQLASRVCSVLRTSKAFQFVNF
jgi:indole-3-glycerol phosphate synthase